MEKGKVGEGKIHIIYYIGEIYRGEGKGDLPRKGEGEVFAGGKGMFRGRISRKELGLGER